MEKITFLHTNDIHSHLEVWPRILRFFQEERRQDEHLFAFDIGDAIDRHHPLTDVTRGRANIEIMDEAHYDGATIGNNEGLVLPHADLNRLYDHANFPILLANLLELPAEKVPDWAQPYQIYTSEGGHKIAVIGLTAPYHITYEAVGWKPLEIDAVLDQYLPLLHERADVVVLLSHLGLPTDKRLAEKYDLDLIIGAHTHHVLPDGELTNGTMLAAAGRYGDHVGKVELSLNDAGKVEKAWAHAYPTKQMAVEPGDNERIEGWLKEGQRRLAQEHIANLAVDRTVEDQAQDALQALTDYCDVPAAMVSTGMFLTPLSAGPLNAADLIADMPHAVNPMLVTLSGRELKELVHEVQDSAKELLNLSLKGSGFRGKEFGRIVFRGIDQTADGQILYNGEAVQDDQDYRLATLDHYRWIKYFPVLDDAKAEFHLGTLLRELMADYYRKKD
ncbi:bifunctional metallophosphatase/5'-nucleotidase [Eupransor demetentiae]|uniref:5'-nucleotidase family (UshA) n=1 Tax=Eupransor demetentiae TaxID=3109584 RepID=A0ABP0END4_9LACO|nr:2' [Lactobacillaceae bacterium LMG 33000]